MEIPELWNTHVGMDGGSLTMQRNGRIDWSYFGINHARLNQRSKRNIDALFLVLHSFKMLNTKK
jgi:hypothetical protein